MTNEQYTDAKNKISANDSAREKWCSFHKTQGVPVDISESFPFAAEVNNELRSAVEMYEFCEQKPDKYFLYIDETKRVATNWMSEVLGNVQFGREYTAVFGDKRQSVRIKAINGKTYSGTYFKSAGSYARVKSVKG